MAKIMNFMKNKKLKSELSYSEITEKLKKIFCNAVGFENSLTIDEIYIDVFGTAPTSKLEWMYNCMRISHTISYLKKNTYYFIVGRSFKGEYRYYVLKTQQEADYYKAKIDSRIEAFNRLKERADKAVKEQFYFRLKGNQKQIEDNKK